MMGRLAIATSDLLRNFVTSPNRDPVPAVGIQTLYDIVKNDDNHLQAEQHHLSLVLMLPNKQCPL